MSIRIVIEITAILLGVLGTALVSHRKIKMLNRQTNHFRRELADAEHLVESKIQERTRQIEEDQLEKIHDLYRLAEFGRLSSGLFHDLMNPLNGVIASVQELEHRPNTVCNVKKYLARAVQTSRCMSDFMGKIHNHICTDSFDQQFSLNRELFNAAGILQFRARKSGVVVITKQSKPLSTFGNPIKFHQIAVNLIANAIDACEGRENPTVRVRLSKFDGNAMLRVTDCGCGVPEGLLDKMFDPFFTTKSKHRGMGIGLSHTKSIVEKNFGGTIQVNSIEGCGTTFTITIPLRKQITSDHNI